MPIGAKATTGFVGGVIDTNVTAKATVLAAQASAFPANTYTNGSAGEGARLTADANGAFPTVDDIAIPLNARILVRLEGVGNGYYDLADAGSAGTEWVLERSSDADIAEELDSNSNVWISQGTMYADQIFTLVNDGALVVGTTVFDFQIASSSVTELGIKSTGTGVFDMKIANSENLAADRTYTVKLNDANRTLELAADVALDQNLRVADSPTFTKVSVNGLDIVLDADSLTPTTLQAASPVSTTTLILPDATDTLVGRISTDTLKNKTLTSPDINGGTVDGLTSLSSGKSDFGDPSGSFSTYVVTDLDYFSSTQDHRINAVNNPFAFGGAGGVGAVVLSEVTSGTSGNFAIYGIGVATNSSGTLASNHAIEADSYIKTTGTATVTNASGVSSYFQVDGTGIGGIIRGAGFMAFSPFKSSGDIDLYAQFLSDDPEASTAGIATKTYHAYFRAQTGGAKVFVVDSKGKVGIGIDTPTEALDIVGNITTTGSLVLGTDLAVADGGTGGSTASAARTNLGAQVNGAVLDDFITLGAPAVDGQFIVSTGAGTFTYEDGNVARTSLGLGTGDSPIFSNVNANQHVGTATGGGVAAAIIASGAGAAIGINDTSATANNKSWDFLPSNDDLLFRAVNDANTLAETYMQVSRTAQVIDNVSFPNGTIDIINQIKIQGGSPAQGKTLTSDVDGLASWEVSPNGRGVMSVGSLAHGTSFSAVTGATVTLPSAGTYRVFYSLRGRVNANSKFLTGRLFNQTSSTAVPDTEAIIFFENAGTFTDAQATSSMETFITVTASAIIRLEARGSTATGCDSMKDGNGITVIGFSRI